MGRRFIGVYCTLRETGEYDSFVAVFIRQHMRLHAVQVSALIFAQSFSDADLRGQTRKFCDNLPNFGFSASLGARPRPI